MSLAALLRDVPIRRKLTLIAVLSAGAALLFVALISMAQQWFTFRAELEKVTHSQAIIVAANSTSALLFNDPKAAKQTLEALGAVDNIEFAMLHDKQGKMFAIFVQAGQKHPTPHHPPQGEQHIFTSTDLDVFHPIILGGELVGTIHLRASLAHVYRQMAWSAAVVIASALAGLGLTLMLVAYMHPAITGPMAKLVGLMDVVSREKNYGLRAELRGKDELGALAHGLNDMLVQIQARDNALGQSRQRLEYEVAQRTAELKEANILLGKELTERKAAEQALQLVNEQLSILLESLPVAIYRRLANGGYPVTYVTRNVVTLSGYPSRSFTEETDFWIKHIHPSDAPRIPAEMACLFEEGVYEYEYRWLNADGSYRWILDSMRLVQPADRTPSYIVGMWWDITERKQAEERIRESEERYRGIFEYTDDIVYLINQDGTFRSLSPAFERHTGWKTEEWIGKPFAPLIHADDLSDATVVFKKALSGESTPSFRLRIARKSGQYFDADLSITRLGRDVAMGIARDVTERQRAEEEIRRQRELLGWIIETIPMRVFWKDRDSRYLGCNTLFAKDAGLLRPDELIGKTDFDMGWKDQAELYRADDRLVMDSNTPKLSYDEPQTTPEGGQIWLRTSKVPLHSEVDEAIGMLGVYEDITAYKQMELSLRESEERFRKAFQNSAIGMALVGLDGHWLKVNDALCKTLGYSEQEFLSKTFQDITHPDDLVPSIDIQVQLLAGGVDHYQMEKRYLHKNGRVIWARVSVSLIRDAQDNPIHFVTQVDDITEDKVAEEKIRKLNDELEEKVLERTKQLLEAQDELVRKEKLAVLGQVAGSVGHELRNPLGVMNNAVYFLQTVLSDADETTKEYLNIIKDEIADSERIVSDLLDSVRTKPPRPETAGVEELIGQTLRKCVIPATVTVKLDIPKTLSPLQVDSQQIQQVFRNLISNGVEAMPEGGTLEIRAVENKPEGNIAISVRDTGTGIAPDVLPKLFQPLFTTKARGIGLGLVVVKNLTQANGGRVEVQSEVGKGTLFSITLPSAGSAVETA